MLIENLPPKPPTAREIWQAYVDMYWLKEVERPLGRRGNVIRTENPNAHLARNLTYAGYKDGCYTLACRDANFLAWAKVKLVNLGKELTIFAKSLGIERQVKIEFIHTPPPEKF